MEGRVIDLTSWYFICIYVQSSPLYRHLWGNSHLALYRGWRYIEGWHSNEICSLMAMMKVSAEQ